MVDGVDPRALLILDGRAAWRAEGRAGHERVRSSSTSGTSSARPAALDAMEDELSLALEREVTAVFLEKDPDGLRDKPDKHTLN